mmetsp:Transcript_28300/g.66456  ORF Transcript_28300/g.66456 Transcript_28300/m.66456 type:complete len:85 (+) Transcript_28300:471-725(+)
MKRHSKVSLCILFLRSNAGTSSGPEYNELTGGNEIWCYSVSSLSTILSRNRSMTSVNSNAGQQPILFCYNGSFACDDTTEFGLV